MDQVKVAYILTDIDVKHHPDHRRFAKVNLTHKLLKDLGYLKHKNLSVHQAGPATLEEMAEFHDEDYLRFLRTVNPKNKDRHKAECRRYTIGWPDAIECPIYEGMYEEAAMVAGGSLMAARLLNEGRADVAINWQGGDHHPGKDDASGFGYVNDIVLAIKELRKKAHRVLYVDIDVHHGDGVQEAFYDDHQVMTVSFHKYGDAVRVEGNKRKRLRFYPGTGAVTEQGAGKGKHYTVNVPIRHGATDETFVETLFRPILTKVIDRYQPGAIVLQCGADSLAGDELGVFHLSIQGHAECVRFLKAYYRPLLLLGGGGYGNPINPARCWAYETAVALGVPRIPKQLTLIEPCEDTMYEAPPPARKDDPKVKEELNSLLSRILLALDSVKSHSEVVEEERRAAAEGNGAAPGGSGAAGDSPDGPSRGEREESLEVDRRGSRGLGLGMREAAEARTGEPAAAAGPSTAATNGAGPGPSTRNGTGHRTTGALKQGAGSEGRAGGDAGRRSRGRRGSAGASPGAREPASLGIPVPGSAGPSPGQGGSGSDSVAKTRGRSSRLRGAAVG